MFRRCAIFISIYGTAELKRSAIREIKTTSKAENGGFFYDKHANIHMYDDCPHKNNNY